MQEISTKPINTTWDLKKHFYSDINDKRIEEDFKRYEEQMNYVIQKYSNVLRNFNSYKEWSDFFDDTDEHTSTHAVNKVFMYFSYISSLDTQNQEIIRTEAYFSNRAREISEKLLCIDEEFKAIGYDRLMELSQDVNLKAFSKFFYDRAQGLKYELDSAVEKAFVITSRADVSSCNVSLYNELKNSFMFEMEDENGNLKKFTEEELSAYLFNENRGLRKRASKVLKEKYLIKQNQIVFGNIYSSIVKNSVSSILLRKYDSVMSPRNIAENLEDETVNILLEQLQQRIYPLYQRFLRLKKKVLGIDVMRTWDLYAPIGKTSKKFEFTKGVELFLGEMKKVDSEMYEYCKEMFEDSRVDVFSKEGKRGGAYCNFLQHQKSFVLLNYNETLNDVLTIAHEFGHAYHGYKLQQQPSRYYWCGLSLAETASVFNELLLSHKLLEQIGEENRDEKMYMLDQELSGFFGTIARQVMYVQFEKRVHEKFYGGEDLTYEDFNILFREEQEKLYEDVIEFDTSPIEDISWSRIPHIHELPFYCYSYAFGQTLSISLYERYCEEKEDFISKYKKILEAGSSQSPKDILKDVGIDINSKEFYNRCEMFISRKIDEFEKLVQKN